MNTVIFDMDGVLLDSEQIFLDSLNLYVKELNIGEEIPMELFSHLTGKKDEEIAAILIRELHLQKTIEECVHDQSMYFNIILKKEDRISPMPGLLEFLEELKEKHFAIALASSSNMEWIQEVLTKLDIRQYFDTIVSGDHVAISKPRPDIFLKAAENCHAAVQDCFVIEDSYNGVLAGKNAGMFVVGYKGSNILQDTSLADLEVKAFSEIPLDSIMHH